MAKVNMLRILLFLIAFSFSANVYSQMSYTPPKGSKERKEIMDYLRTLYTGGADDDCNLFKVNHLKKNTEWAVYSVTSVNRKGEMCGVEFIWGILQKRNGKWKDINWEEGEEFEDELEPLDFPTRNSRVAKLIARKFKGCSLDLFP